MVQALWYITVLDHLSALSYSSFILDYPIADDVKNNDSQSAKMKYTDKLL